MGEALLESQATVPTSTGSLVFRFLPAYAAFIRDNHLIPYISEQIRASRETNIPILKFLEGISDEQLIAMGIENHKIFLTNAENNTLRQHIEQSLKKWVADQLVIMKREEITAEDIILAGYVRKKALQKFLPSYTTDVNEAVAIINEIDILTVEADMMATNVYIQLLKDRISEQAFFTEVLSNTTPGLNYIFDLKEQAIKYANKNATKFFGNTPDEMKAMGPAIIADKTFPDDVPLVIEGLRKCAVATDGEVISWEFRIKSAAGDYVWMRNYSSVYKRDESGAASEVVGIILDIAVEKEVADKLLLSERQLLDAQAQAELGSYEMDVETGEMQATPQLKAIFEITGDMHRSALANGVHPADKARLDEMRAKIMSDSGDFDLEYKHIVNGKEKTLWSRGRVSVKKGRKIMMGTVMDVTGRHNMIKQLQESDDRYKQAQALAHIGNWSMDLVSGKIEWSDELYSIYGLPLGSHLSFEEIMSFHGDDNDKIKENLQRNIDAGLPSETYYKATLKDGTRKILHAKTEVLTNEDGKAYKLIGIIQDVTEKQQLLEKLQESDELFKQAQARTHIGNWTWDIPANKVKWSDEMFRVYGLEPQSEEVNYETYLAHIHPDDRETRVKQVTHVFETGEPEDHHYRIVWPDGGIRILHTKSEIQYDEQGRPARMMGTCQDITEQKMAERKLKETQEFTQKVTDVTPSIIATYNVRTGKFSFINNALEKRLGYSVSDALEGGAAFFTSITHPDDLPSLTEKNGKALEEANNLAPGAEEPVVEFKYRMKNKNGQYRWFHTFGTIFERDANGQVDSVLNISIDITDQEEAEQAVFRKNLQLQQSNTSLEEYAYVASHDLKEPLRKIVTFSDRMLTTQHARLDEDGKLFLEKIIDSSRRMQKMIGDLLYVSTILGNNDFQLCDLQVVLGEAIQAVDHKIEEMHATIEAENLPTVLVVPSQFRQLFQNLISNSLKFARKGLPPEIKITHSYLNSKAVERFDLTKAKKYLRIEFHDNGIGFDSQYSTKIFALFQRLHGKAEYEGTGIGLAVCKKIVENHGGVISAHGIPNGGATFTIIIPV